MMSNCCNDEGKQIIPTIRPCDCSLMFQIFASNYLENLVYHFFRQLWLVLRVKLMEINSNLFSRYVGYDGSLKTPCMKPSFGGVELNHGVITTGATRPQNPGIPGRDVVPS